MLHWARNERAASRAAYERALQLDSNSMTALNGVVSLDLADQKTASAKARLDPYLKSPA